MIDGNWLILLICRRPPVAQKSRGVDDSFFVLRNIVSAGRVGYYRS
jgi:hypothetical protein